MKKNTTENNSFNNLFGGQRTKENYNIVISGHRGGRKLTQPENTLRAFKEAIEIGLKAIELDVSQFFIN